ncbi:hypothetical protein ABIC83_002668 [Roseateles asaccharophilus]|uniref:type 4b pilus protein PilO2 n=1 Tax=Roseateles asaccharophilus TaxID=582607 RepID=UPI003834FA71
MASVQIANISKPVAVGLDWRALDGSTSQRKEIATLVKSEGVKFGCVIDDEDAGITIVGLDHDQSEGQACGAAWLAAAVGRIPAILVEPISDTHLWICAVRAGMPVQGLDVIVEVADLHARLHDFQLQNTDAKIISSLDSLDVAYGDGVSPESFAELVANVAAPKVVRISGVNPKLVGVVGLALVAVACWYGYDVYTTQQVQAQARARLAQLNSDQARDAAAAQEKARQVFLAQAESVIRKAVLEQPGVDAVVSSVFAEVDSKPLTLGSWSLVSFDCDSRVCHINWKRLPGSTMLIFMKAAEAKGWIVERVSGNDAVTGHPVSPEPRSLGVDRLDEVAPFLAALESRLQEASALNLRYEVSKPETIDKMMNLPPADPKAGPAGQPAQQPLPYRVGTVKVQGTKLFELRELPNFIAHPGLGVKRISFDVKSGEWILEMNYATR